jgi:cell division protein FtsW
MNPPQRGTPDFILLFLTFALIGFGLVMVFSASYSITYQDDPLSFTKRQMLFAVLGTIVMFIMMNTSYQQIKKLFVPFFLFVLILLILVLIIGEERNGARSWFGIGPFGGQPTEFAKIGIILYLSVMITRKGEKLKDFRTGLLPILIMVGLVGFLIMLQPDLGSCVILLLTASVVIIVGGARKKHIFWLTTIATSVLVTVILVELWIAHQINEPSYRLRRLLSYLNPWEDPLDSGHQLIQSWYALGHGGLTGAGFGQSIQKLHYLPYAHNDFIFAIIGEELGFIGAAIFLLVYILFMWRGLLVSLRCSDVTGTLVGTGIVGMIGIQALINIGGVIGAIPITGVTLPFISFGGSSLLATMFAVGILLSISRENNKVEKNKNSTSSSTVRS